MLDGITDLFVPDVEFLSEKIDLIKSKFDFVDNIKLAWNNASELFVDGDEKVPKISIDLSKSEGKYNYGTTAFALDMSWYSRYKPSVDAVIIAFSYLAFIFLVFKRLPEIISGSGAITIGTTKISDKGGK